MREIKFRAWDTYDKKMYSWNYLGELDSNNFLSLWNVLAGQVEHIIPQEYIGLKDKNGKEIYDGDIVVTKFQYATDEGLTAEEVHDHEPMVIEYDVDIRNQVCGFSFFPCKDEKSIEVIGNIYENPDILQRKMNDIQSRCSPRFFVINRK